MRTVIYGLLLCLTLTAFAADRTYTVPTNSLIVNHWPSTDQFIGTSDDMVSGALSTYAQSSPNQPGSYSYIATTFAPHATPDPLLFGTYDAITFVQGFVTVDPTSFVTNGVPQLSGLEFSGTELFPGHGPYYVKLTNRRGGEYNHTGNVIKFTCHYDFEGTFVAGPATATNAYTVGTIVLIDASDFDKPTLTGLDDALTAYVKNVAVPVAKANQATGLIAGVLDLQTGGSLPGTTGGFPPLIAHGVVLAVDTAPLQTNALTITSVQWTADGPRLTWAPLGQTVTVEATEDIKQSFQSLAPNLTASEYVDRSFQSYARRFYRLRTP